MFDIHQMQRSLKLVGDGDEQELMIDPDGVHAVEQFVLAKYYMTASVYRHRVRLITDQMIGRAIQLGIEADQVEALAQLYRFDNSDGFVRNYQQWDDARFMETFCPSYADPPGQLSGELLRRLRSRQLLKQIYSERIENLDARVREALKEISKPNQDRVRNSIESEIANLLAQSLHCEVQPRFVIVHWFSIKSVRESARNDEAEVLVEGDPPRLFSDESKLIKSINAAYADDLVEVYAPIEWPNREERDHLKTTWKAQIQEFVVRNCLANRRTNS